MSVDYNSSSALFKKGHTHTHHILSLTVPNVQSYTYQKCFREESLLVSYGMGTLVAHGYLKGLFYFACGK